MPDTAASATTDITEVLNEVLAVETYIGIAVAGYEVPASTRFDPYLGLATLQLATTQLHAAALGPNAPMPLATVSADSGQLALQLAQAQLVAAGEHVVDLIRADRTTPTKRRLLADILPLLSDAHQELFGERW